MSHTAQFTLYSHLGGPNGWSVAFAFEELGLTYETILLDFTKDEQKAPEFTKYNPNGRIPVIIDHGNNDFVLWESAAILQYIVDKYDKEHKISIAPGTDEYYIQLQWLYFQASGQGPLFGQADWFTNYHPEKVPGAIERYTKEINRVFSVLESVLTKREWLVSNKATVSDFVFVTWTNAALNVILKNFDFEKEFPATAKWHSKLRERPAIVRALAPKIKGMGY